MSNYLIAEEEQDAWELQQALTGLEVEAMNFGRRMINISKVRLEYMAKTQALAQEYLYKVQIRELSVHQAAQEVNSLRNEIMKLTRMKTADIGRAYAIKIKPYGRTMEELCEKYAKELFHRNFTRLTKAEHQQVYKAIIKGGGRADAVVNKVTQSFSRAGRGLFVLSLGIAIYNVATADNKLRAAGNEGVIIGGGIAGGAAGGTAAGLLCGPGAPVCVTVGVFLGGLLGGVGFDMAFDELF